MVRRRGGRARQRLPSIIYQTGRLQESLREAVVGLGRGGSSSNCTLIFIDKRPLPLSRNRRTRRAVQISAGRERLLRSRDTFLFWLRVTWLFLNTIHTTKKLSDPTNLQLALFALHSTHKALKELVDLVFGTACGQGDKTAVLVLNIARSALEAVVFVGHACEHVASGFEAGAEDVDVGEFRFGGCLVGLRGSVFLW